LAGVDEGGGKHAESGVAVVGVVGVEELGAGRPAFCDGGEVSRRKLGQYFRVLNRGSL